MTTNIAIIGLGEIGTSLAMAFMEQGDTFSVTGLDYLRSAERRAEENHWVGKIEHNLFDAVEDADTVILAVPADQTRGILELIGHSLKENVFVIDCCPNKCAASAWARQYMDHPENYIGLWFGINPQYLGLKSDGGKTAAPDFFRGGTLFIAAERDTAEDTIKLASGLADMLEMECSFVEPVELDVIISASYHLPVLASHALMRCVIRHPGWLDGKKAAGKVFCAAAEQVNIKPDREEAGFSLIESREHSVRLLNEYISELKTLRDMLQNSEENELRTLIGENEKALDQWLIDYRKSNLESEHQSHTVNVSASEILSQTFFGGLLRRKPKN